MSIFSNHPATQWVAAIIAAGAVAAAGWWPVGRWRSKVERDLDLARENLDAGQWDEALLLVRKHQPAESAPAASWHETRRLLEGECLVAAGDAALRQQRYSEALARYQDAATVLGLPESEASQRVVEAMLGELRRLSAEEPLSPTLPELAVLIGQQKSDTGEAAFWHGLHDLRRGDHAGAIDRFTSAYAHSQGLQIDPVLYLGALRLRDGSPREALRSLVEANKLAPNCPLVAWLLGTALVATGGDALLAVRALQKAVGPDGLVRYLAEPARIWIDTLPRGSWLRNLVRRTGKPRSRFVCPLKLDQLKDVLESARLTLAEALLDCRRHREAASLFQELLRTRDDLAVQRGLGVALAELERYGEALPHLERAKREENPPSSRTIGSLARCWSHASGDRIGNLQRAIALIESAPTPRDRDWARHAAAVVLAAQSAGVPVADKLIVELARALIAADAADRSAATVYDFLARRDPAATPIEAAWLYVRAAEREGFLLESDDRLFDRAFTDRARMMQYFEARAWDFVAAERLYLQRWANRQAGGAAPSGRQQRAIAEANLMTEAKRQLTQCRLDDAQTTIELAQKLSPENPRVHDLLAELAFRRGHIEESIDWLQRWSQLDPKDPLPLVRAALIRRQQGGHAEARPLLDRALSLAHGPARASIALLAARLAVNAGQRAAAQSLVEECLTFDSHNAIAMTARAAILIDSGESANLSSVATSLADLRVEDARTHLLIGVAAFRIGDDRSARDRAKQCINNHATAADAHHLLAAVRLRAHRESDAVAELKLAVDRATGATEESARVLLGQVLWHGGQYSEALRAWQPIAAARMKARGLDTLIPGGAFLAGLSAAKAAQWDEAAKWWRAAARLGFDHPQLDALLADAVDSADAQHVAARLESALESAGPRLHIVRKLARSYRQLGRLSDAQKLLDAVSLSNAHLLVERGLLQLANHQLVAAERAFAEAHALDSQIEAAAVNLLFCRLSLGRWNEAQAILPQAAELASAPSTQRLCRLLADLMSDPPHATAAWTTRDDDLMLDLARGAARLETAESILAALLAIRGKNPRVQQAHADLQPLIAKQWLDRGDAAGVLRRFGPAAAGASRPMRNLLGVAASLRQDFDSAIRHFQAALPPDGADARVQQNLAIVRGWQGRHSDAVEHWRRYLGLLRQVPRPKNWQDYRARITTLVQAKLRALE